MVKIMNRDVLTLLGCSGSLAFVMLTGHAASAEKIPPQYLGVGGPQPIDAQRVNEPLSQESPQPTALNPNSEKIGELALLKFGCQCMNCRNAVVSMIQSGSLASPQ